MGSEFFFDKHFLKKYLLKLNGEKSQVYEASFDVNFEICNVGDSCDRIGIDFYIKDGNVAKYHGTLYLRKETTGHGVLSIILNTIISKHEKQQREFIETGICFPEGMEVKQTFLFPTNMVRLSSTKCRLKDLHELNSAFEDLDLSPVVIKRRANAELGEINIKSDFVYSYNRNFPFLFEKEKNKFSETSLSDKFSVSESKNHNVGKRTTRQEEKQTIEKKRELPTTSVTASLPAIVCEREGMLVKVIPREKK